MTTSDVLALLALIVSLASFVVAGYTFYQQFIRRAELDIELGPSVVLAYGKDLTWLAATISISLSNTGARDTFVTKINGRLTNEDATWDSPVLWYAFYKPMDAGRPGKTSVPWWGFDGWVSPIVVPSRESVSKSVSFNVGPLAGPLLSGVYRLALTFTTHPSKGPATVWSSSFTLTDQHELEQTAGVGSVSVASVVAELSPSQRISSTSLPGA